MELKLIRLKHSNTFRYTLYGALFGFAFPVVASVIEIFLQQLPQTLESLLQVQRTSPLLWIIDTAPLFLGLFASFAGRRKDHADRLNELLKERGQDLETLQASLERKVAEHTRGLLAAAEVSRATTSVLDPDELLRQTVNLVRERFDLYYVGLFLLDEEGRFAVLRAGTGEAGRQMLDQEHKLEVGGDSMIGQCTSRCEARIALDVGEEAVWFNNPFLTHTRSEMALPLVARGRVMGAMTVQDTKEAAFDEADIAVMQTMADQVAVAIDNARLFSDAERLFDESQAALEEVEATHRRYLGQAWAAYTRSRQASGYQYSRKEAQNEAQILPLAGEMLPAGQQAMAERRSVTEMDNGSQEDPEQEPSSSTLVTPILLRGQPIGALGFRARGRQWSDDEIALAEAIAEQFALAADNLRLLDETQGRAAREQLTSEITSRMRETLDMDTILKTTVREIGEALDFAKVEVRMG
jgi:GAF domain-containing protein